MHRTVLTYSPSEPLLSIESKFNLRQLVLFKILKFVHMSEISKKVRLSTVFFFLVWLCIFTRTVPASHRTYYIKCFKNEKKLCEQGKRAPRLYSMTIILQRSTPSIPSVPTKHIPNSLLLFWWEDSHMLDQDICIYIYSKDSERF